MTHVLWEIFCFSFVWTLLYGSLKNFLIFVERLNKPFTTNISFNRSTNQIKNEMHNQKLTWMLRVVVKVIKPVPLKTASQKHWNFGLVNLGWNLNDLENKDLWKFVFVGEQNYVHFSFLCLKSIDSRKLFTVCFVSFLSKQVIKMFICDSKTRNFPKEILGIRSKSL